MDRKVELHPAFVWDCDECGRENFVRAVVAEMSEEEEAEAKEYFGYEPWEDGEFLRSPKTVQCEFCGAEFDTLDPDLLDEDEEEEE